MQTNNFAKRFLNPMAIVFIAMIGSRIVYFNSSMIDNHMVYQYVAIISGIIHFFSIGFGAMFIYPTAYLNGASRMERVICCLITPLSWNFIEIYKVSEVFTFFESLYYGVNSLALLTFVGTFAMMAVCEVACRYIVKRRDNPIKIITPVPVMAVVTLFVTIYVTAIWGNGAHWFYIFLNGYIILFGS